MGAFSRPLPTHPSLEELRCSSRGLMHAASAEAHGARRELHLVAQGKTLWFSVAHSFHLGVAARSQPEVKSTRTTALFAFHRAASVANTRFFKKVSFWGCENTGIGY